MAKLYTYIIICIGLIVLFNLAGLQTFGGTILEKIGITSIENISGFQSGLAYTAMYALLITITGLAAGSIIASFFGKTISTDLAYGTFATSLLILFIADLVSMTVALQTETPTWIAALVSLIMLPFIVGFIITIVDWMKGIA